MNMEYNLIFNPNFINSLTIVDCGVSKVGELLPHLIIFSRKKSHDSGQTTHLLRHYYVK